MFHPFYHPFTRLFWNQLAGGGFDLLYDPDLQQVPDNVDPSYADVFSFQNGYQPTWRVQWDLADASTTLASSISASQTAITVTNNIWVPSPAFYVSIGSEILLVTAVGGTNNTTWTVARGQQGTAPAPALGGAAVTPTAASQDRQFLDFSPSSAFLGLQLGAFLPHPALYRAAPQPEPAVRGRPDLVPVHFQSHPPGQRPGAAALLDSQAAPRSH